MRCLIAAFVAVLLAPSTSVTAERSICGSHAIVAGYLARQWRETVSWRGLAGGNLVELYTAADGGWTLVMTRPDGVACFIASGRDGESTRPTTDGEHPS